MLNSGTFAEELLVSPRWASLDAMHCTALHYTGSVKHETCQRFVFLFGMWLSFLKPYLFLVYSLFFGICLLE